MSWRDDDRPAERDWTAAVIALADAPPVAPASEEPAAEDHSGVAEPTAGDDGTEVAARTGAETAPREPAHAAVQEGPAPGGAAPAPDPVTTASAHGVAELDMSRAVVVVPAHDPEENAELTRRLHRLAMRIDIMAGAGGEPVCPPGPGGR